MCPRFDRGDGDDATSTTHARRAGAARLGSPYPGELHRSRFAACPALRTQPRHVEASRCSSTCCICCASATSHSSVNQYGCAFRLPLRHRAGAGRRGLPDSTGHRPAAVARDPLARRTRATVHRTTRSEKPRTFLMVAYGTGLRLSEMCHLRVDRHRQPCRPHVHSGRARQGRQGPLRAAGPRMCWICCVPGGAARTREGGCSPPHATRRNPSRFRAPRSGTRPRAARMPASPSAAASTRCATATPRICWRPV